MSGFLGGALFVWLLGVLAMAAMGEWPTKSDGDFWPVRFAAWAIGVLACLLWPLTLAWLWMTVKKEQSR